MTRIRCVALCFLFLVGNLNAQIRPTHTVMLILENHSYSEIAGNPQAPFINTLLNDSHTATMAQSYALNHPSQPNYIMLYSGSSQGITDNNLPSGLPFTSPNLGTSLIQGGFSFVGYSEDLPAVGFTGELSGAYVRRHNPWVNWQGTGTNSIPSASNRPFSDFPLDPGQLPTVSIVVPNLNHDINDGTIAECDTWIQNNLSPFIEWCKTNNGLFILTFDEDDFSANNKILTFLTGSNIKAGSYNQPITHYNVLRTIEELYALPYAGASADSLQIQNIWLTALPVRFLAFSVTSNKNTCILKWQTLEERNTREFKVERSVDNGQHWLTIATVPAAGTTDEVRNYSYTDNNPVDEMNFYRIKEIDQTDQFSYSEVLSSSIKLITAYKSFPNPVNGFLYIRSAKNEDELVVVSVTDMSGRLTFRKRLLLKAGNPAKIDLSHLAEGEYFLDINNGTQKKTEAIILK